MGFTNEFLKDVFSKEDVSVEDKIALIEAEHNADITGLKSKNSELLGKLDKSKKEYEELTAGKTELEGKFSKLSEELKKNNPEDLKKLLENQFAEKESLYKKQVADLTAERDTLKANDIKRLLNESIADGVKDLVFMEGLRDGFIARVMSLYQFEPKEIDGQTKFYTSDMKEVKDVMKEFSLSNEGKAYIRNPSMGGGATGSQTGGNSGVSKMAKTREQFEKMNAQEKADFFKNGGTLV